MTKCFRFAALLLLAGVSWAAPAAAQTDTVAVWKALAPVCPGAQVRLALVEADSVRGPCGRVESGRLVVGQGVDERRIALARIDSVWVSASGSEGTARAGGFIGALMVGGAFAYVSNGICDAGSGCLSDTAVVGGIGALLGYLTGSLFGGLIGRGITVWDRRYPL